LLVDLGDFALHSSRSGLRRSALVSQTIGRTPVVRVNRLAPPHVRIYVKLEAANPGGSVKDRLARRRPSLASAA